jgi:hypothetical protein
VIAIRVSITFFCDLVSVNRLMLFKEIIAIYYPKRKEHKNILCEHNAEFWFVKAGGTSGF